MHPEVADWTLTNRLLAMVVNCLRLLLWAKTKDGQKGKRRPPMIGPDWGDDTPKRAGSQVKAAPLSVIKAAFSRDGENKRGKLRKLFGR